MRKRSDTVIQKSAIPSRNGCMLQCIGDDYTCRFFKTCEMAKAVNIKITRVMHCALLRCKKNAELRGIPITYPDRDALTDKLRECIRTGCRCSECGGFMIFPGILCSMGNLSFDHVIPLSNGGTNDADNMVICHTHCNHIKQHKS